MYCMTKKMNAHFVKANKILAAMLLLAPLGFSYADEASLTKYQQARIAVTYKGNVGDLSQQLAEKLGIGYYATQHNSSIQVKLKQTDNDTLQHLLDQINQQLKQQNSNQQLRFDMLDDKVVLALVGNNVSLAPTQFIGDVVYDNKALVQEEEERNIISVPIVSVPTEKESEKPEDDSSKKLIENISVPPQSNKGSYSEVSSAEEKKLGDILALSQDTKLISQYAKRKVPTYNVVNQHALGLENIRSTKISTFLIFKDGIDMSKYKVEGQFQDIAIVGNVVGILHRQKVPPKEILITAPDKQQYKLAKAN